MAERELAILLRARDMASKTIKGVKGEMRSLGKIGGQAVRGLTTNLTRLGVVAGVGLTAAVLGGVRSLGHLQRVTAQTEAVISSTGGAAGVTAKQVRDLSSSLEDLTTADDKNIQEGANLLLTFTKIGKDTFPRATKAAVNMAIAMAKGDVANADFKGSALQVGKALNDPIKGITALSRAGVSFTKQQKDQITQLVKAGKVQQAQKLILKELETEFGKAGEAAGKGPEATWRRLQDVGEDLQQSLAKRLLPVLQRAGEWLKTKLSDPQVIAFMDDLGEEIGQAADAALKFVEGVDWRSIGKGVGQAKDIAGSVVSMFMGLPDWVKTAVITGWGLNKLTGGAVGSLIGELGKGLIKGVLGMTAGVVNIKAGVVNGGGGLPTPTDPLKPEKGGKLSTGGKILDVASKVLIVGLVAEAAQEIHGSISQAGADLHNQLGIKTPLDDMRVDQLQWPFGPKNTPTILPDIFGGNGLLGGTAAAPPPMSGTSDLVSEMREQNRLTSAAKTSAEQAQRVLADRQRDLLLQSRSSERADAIKANEIAAAARSAGVATSTAIRNKDLSVALTVPVTINQTNRVQVSSRNVISQTTTTNLIARGSQRIQS